MRTKHLGIFIISLLLTGDAIAQKKPVEKYPSLLWEITGNGLKKPSYLFGTMHVSNKLAFHLSDSFYHALRNVDAVALELNPEVWQGQMARLDRLKDNYSSFVQPAGNEFITENSFRIKNYTDELTAALRTEPSIVNNLLYRSYKAREDFEEDTFLDMYIYQTGRKLGKRPAGVEDYYEAEKLILEAYGDMAREKKKKNIDMDGENMRDIFEKVQNAYRRGDLDMMDSLDNLMETSFAFREKFLFKRNEIQANSIDTIIQKASLFAGVGAAHLPGNRGVIEILRRKGYTLRPVKMAERDAVLKSEIDNLKVPVVFQKRMSDDGFYVVDVPGELFKISQDYQAPDRRQFADMSNGSYYIVTRVKTHAAFLNQSPEKVLRKVDSLLYENIPGKILSKKQIERNKYPGYDITARTRRGDMQRYNIFITPFEVLIFKMSGKDNYVSGEESDRFFSSISLKEQSYNAVLFEPAQGGFSIHLPQMPHQYFNNKPPDDRWEYEALDKASGKAYLILKRSAYNFNHLDDDAFSLSLLEESFHNEDLFDKQISRTPVKINGRDALEVREKLKDGSPVRALFYINGPHYYVVAVRGNKHSDDAAYFNSFQLKPFKYPAEVTYADTFLHAKVVTGIVPEIDDELRRIIEQSAEDVANGFNNSGYISYWPKVKNGVFRSDSTGEMVAVQVQEYPRYFYSKDSARYWQNEISELVSKNDMEMGSVKWVADKDAYGVRITLKDTGSTRTVNRLILVKNNYKYSITTVGDSLYADQEFVQKFFATFRPYYDTVKRDLYESRLPQFFDDLFSKDSAVQSRAQQAIPNIYYGLPGVPYIRKSLLRLHSSARDYYETKSKLIAELGFIKDSAGLQVVPLLKEIYGQTADTSLFQNEVVKALARLKTKAAYSELKKLMLQDPPIFENNYDLNTVFSNLRDSLELSAELFPDILQLSSLDDYKDKVLSLLVRIVDSGYIKKEAYEKYFPGIFIDAKVALKKQRNRDEKRRQQEVKSNDTEPVRVYNNPSANENTLANYAILLIPFYEKTDVKLFFNGLLRSDDEKLKLNTAVLMLRNNILVPDNLLNFLAANDKFRGMLYDKLFKNKLLQKFPARYRNQRDLSRSYIVMENDYNRMDSLVYITKLTTTFKGKPGYVHFYKYRIQKENDWKIAMSGLQPMDEKEVAAAPQVSALTEVKIKEDEPIAAQLAAQLKRVLFPLYKSGKNFYTGNESRY